MSVSLSLLVLCGNNFCQALVSLKCHFPHQDAPRPRSLELESMRTEINFSKPLHMSSLLLKLKHCTKAVSNSLPYVTEYFLTLSTLSHILLKSLKNRLTLDTSSHEEDKIPTDSLLSLLTKEISLCIGNISLTQGTLRSVS